jgi:SAM-dependent methyltransferase
MRTARSEANPFGPGRHAYAWERVRAARSRAHLDIGCYDGAFLASLGSLGVRRLVGVDVEGDAIANGRQRFPELELVHVPDTRTLPFDDVSFDSVSLLDVLEHLSLSDQEALLGEVRRVLRPGGAFIVTVPRRHALSVLDLGNLKFRFPRLHRRWYSLRHGAEAYEQRYGANPFGLVGDVSAEKGWHEHFSPAGLNALLAASGMALVDVDGAGRFLRLIVPVRLLAPGRLRPGVTRLIEWDAARFADANLFATSGVAAHYPQSSRP